MIYDGRMFVLHDKGIVTQYDAITGEMIYRARLPPTTFTASPWAYNGKIFFLSEEGDTYVVGTGDEYDLLGVNTLDEFALSSPAIVGDRLLLRTHHRLWSIRNLTPDMSAPS